MQHLSEVAAGLHSVVLGEAQILGQSRHALDGSGAALQQLGSVAIAAARELRAETAFDSHAGHLLDRGLALAGLDPQGRLLVLGTGAMARLVAERGAEIGFGEVIVAGRRPPARPIAGEFVALARVAALPPVTAVAGCLGSGAKAIPLDRLPPSELVLDLGTPRNFEGSAEARVITIAGLLSDEARRPHTQARRGALRERLSTLLKRRIAGRRETSTTAVGALRASVERARRGELARLQRRHPEIAADTLDAMTRSLLNQIFHAPTERLRERGDDQLARDLAALFEDLGRDET